jgi:predicted lipoprotein with Yx(FWY)xxD motif
MEKGILPVLDTLGDAIDFELKFNDYAMHDKKELDEQMSQYCVQQNQGEKLTEYLYCFLEDEKGGDACLSKIGVNKAEHASCVADVDSKYKITEQYNDKSTWRSGRFPVFPVYEDDNKQYGVTGSPSLVVNGNKISAARDSASLLKTICAGFENEPEACQASLSASSPGAGFGFDSTGTGASASCGS